MVKAWEPDCIHELLMVQYNTFYDYKIPVWSSLHIICAEGFFLTLMNISQFVYQQLRLEPKLEESWVVPTELL